MTNVELAGLFEKIGLTSEKAKETAENKKIAPLLEKVIMHVRLNISFHCLFNSMDICHEYNNLLN